MIMDRPNIKDFLGKDATIEKAHEIYSSQPHLFQYVQALDNYIDELEQQSKLKDRSILESYSKFLEKNGYMDSDWWSEEPFAIDEFLKEPEKKKILVLGNEGLGARLAREMDVTKEQPEQKECEHSLSVDKFNHVICWICDKDFGKISCPECKGFKLLLLRDGLTRKCLECKIEFDLNKQQ